MSTELQELFDSNRAWAAATEPRAPGFFTRLLQQQAPQYLWIGCADSRVPANEIVGLLPGELFVHRNVANVVVHSDLNCLSVIQFAIDLLQVRHIIVVGHYGCGGVRAALTRPPHRPGRQLAAPRAGRAQQAPQASSTRCRRRAAQVDALCELNVLEQALNVCETTVVQDAWAARPGGGRARLGLRPAQRPAGGPAHDRAEAAGEIGAAYGAGAGRAEAALRRARRTRRLTGASDRHGTMFPHQLDRHPRLRHRAGDARRLQPPLPAVPRVQRRGQAPLRERPTGTASSARSASASSSTTSASTRRSSGCSASSTSTRCRWTAGSRSSCTTSAC